MLRTPVLKKLNEIVNFENVVKNTIYAPDTVYLFLSATDKEVHILDELSTIRDGAVILQPKQKTNLKYLYYALENAKDEFFNKYVGKAINLSRYDLDFFELLWHENYNDQCEIVLQLKPLENEIENEIIAINHLKNFKAGMLDKMFVLKMLLKAID